MKIRRNPPSKPLDPLKPPIIGSSIWSRIFIPSTQLGWWSVGLMVAFLVTQGILTFVFAAGRHHDDPFLRTLLFFILIGIMGISAIGAGGTAIYAVFQRRERSFPIFMIMLFGFFVIFFIMAELLIGHD